MSGLLKQGESLLSSASGSASSGASSVAQKVESTAETGYIQKGVNAIEAKLGFDKDGKYDQYEKKGIEALEKKFQK